MYHSGYCSCDWIQWTHDPKFVHDQRCSQNHMLHMTGNYACPAMLSTGFNFGHVNIWFGKSLVMWRRAGHVKSLEIFLAIIVAFPITKQPMFSWTMVTYGWCYTRLKLSHSFHDVPMSQPWVPKALIGLHCFLRCPCSCFHWNGVLSKGSMVGQRTRRLHKRRFRSCCFQSAPF